MRGKPKRFNAASDGTLLLPRALSDFLTLAAAPIIPC